MVNSLHIMVILAAKKLAAEEAAKARKLSCQAQVTPRHCSAFGGLGVVYRVQSSGFRMLGSGFS